MKNHSFLFIASLLTILSACQKSETNENIAPPAIEKSVSCCMIYTPLIAGGGKYDENGTGYNIGKIKVTNSDPLIVEYLVTRPGWQIDETHLYVGTECDIPKTNGGNPIPGLFPFDTPDEQTLTTAKYIITDEWNDLYIAATHAAVSYTELTAEDYADILPETALLHIFWPWPYSLFKSRITEADFLNGNYNGWCIDRFRPISTTQDYPVSVYSSYETIPAGKIGHPENLDLVNWLMNQAIVGTNSDCGNTFIWQDVQNALWDLMDDGTSHIQPYNVCEVNELISEASANGEGYVPACGNKLVIVLVPENAQVTIITYPIGPCGNLDETAWGYGTDGHSFHPGTPGFSFTDSPCYGGNRWGWYFYSCAWPSKSIGLEF